MNAANPSSSALPPAAEPVTKSPERLGTFALGAFGRVRRGFGFRGDELPRPATLLMDDHINSIDYHHDSSRARRTLFASIIDCRRQAWKM
jgi:hypothetical protein